MSCILSQRNGENPVFARGKPRIFQECLRIRYGIEFLFNFFDEMLDFVNASIATRFLFLVILLEEAARQKKFGYIFLF